MKMVIPTLFGLEGIVADELKWQKFQYVQADNGKVYFEGDLKDMARANLWVRSGERVQILMREFDALSFEELFQNVKAIPWEQYIGQKDAFPVKGSALHSVLHSVPDCQKIIKKAVVERLKERYHIEWFEETGALYQIQFTILKDHVQILLDTSGPGLHKRGYRKNANAAPIRETLAAGMVDLARVHADSLLVDPFCGSGTIAIEAGLKALQIAPGLFRKFTCENWDILPDNTFRTLREEAMDAIKKDAPFTAYAYDIDPAALELTKENAKKAHIGGRIHVAKRDVKDFKPDADRQITVCNPPYGERLLEIKEAEQIYKTMGSVFQPGDGQTFFVITPHERFETLFGRRADKKRKLYNGMIKCNYYMYYK